MGEKMKHHNFEPWMLGQPVKEIATGDKGIVDSFLRNGEFDSVYVKWTTGSCQGMCLHILIEDIEFIGDSDGEVTYEMYLALLHEVKELRSIVEKIR